MATVEILGRTIPVDYLNGKEAAEPASRLVDLLGEVARLIDRTAWDDEERMAFDALKRIVFFDGEVTVNGWTLNRPGCDEDDAAFYWEVEEFDRCDVDVRVNTLFHDCWHIVQFQQRGDFARTEDDRVGREIDAIERQIRVAEKIGCDPHEIGHLRRFGADQTLILARLLEGVRMHHRRRGEDGGEGEFA